jgi:hypothetical protein
MPYSDNPPEPSCPFKLAILFVGEWVEDLAALRIFQQ